MASQTSLSPSHKDMANAIRFLAIDAVQKANSGHPGMPMGMADVATVLFTRFMNFDVSEPGWINRDRFVLSAGHGSMLHYGLNYLLGYADMTIEQIRNFRQLGSITAGHPEYGHALGIETTTGPLGQGLANAVGMALTERLLNAEFGKKAIEHFTYVIAGDGCLMEGISHEAISIAGHLKLNKLIVMWDDNGITIDGPIELSESGDQIMRFKAAGWNTIAINGQDEAAIEAAIAKAQKSDKPTLIACKTTIGYGSPNKSGKASAHGSPLGGDEIALTRNALGWPHAPFEVPSSILNAWGAAGSRGKAARAAWATQFATLGPKKQAELTRRMAGDLPKAFTKAILTAKKAAAESPTDVATRKAGEIALEAIVPVLPELVSGSADLTGSNNTRTKGMVAVSAPKYEGRYIHWGVREHGMAAAMNGMALHGGVIPVSGGFMVFSDYCRPSIRLAALMGIRVIHVLTHDSIGVGEDGPTHQPVEHLAALRAIPNCNVYRPADQVETLECYQLMLENKHAPSLIALTRQNLKQVRLKHETKNLCAHGAYELVKATGKAKVSLFASGSEVEIAVKAQAELEKAGIATRVVSVPCLDILMQQDARSRAKIIGRTKINVGIEAGIRQGWDTIIGTDGIFVGMSGFGASAPAKDLYNHFGITAEAVVDKVKTRLR